MQQLQEAIGRLTNENQQLAAAIQALQAGGAGGGGGGLTAVERYEKKALQALKGVPHYHHDAKKGWNDFINEWDAWRRVYNLEQNVETAQTIKFEKAAFMSSMRGTASSLANAAVTDADWGETVSTAAFQAKVKLAFHPPEESALQRQVYQQYKQGRKIPAATYIMKKWQIFQTAYGVNERDFKTFTRDAIAGIYNDRVKEDLYRKTAGDNVPTTEPQLRAKVMAAVTAQRNITIQGLPNASDNLDGLAAVTIRAMDEGTWGGGVEDDRGQPEAMDIGRMGEDHSQKKCYNCQKTGHLRRDCRVKSRKTTAGGGGNRRAEQRKGKFDGECRRCGRSGHKQRDCWTTKHKDGHQLQDKPPSKKPGSRKGVKTMGDTSGIHEVTDTESDTE